MFCLEFSVVDVEKTQPHSDVRLEKTTFVHGKKVTILIHILGAWRVGFRKMKLNSISTKTLNTKR